MKTPIIAIAGPTASGKTALGIALAKEFDGEIISCDSMQIYEGMDIASAKPSKEEQQGIPHHLMSFLPPCKSYSVADFVENAKEIAFEIHSRGKLPILVGGTGLYMNSLLDNVTFSKSQKDENYRNSLYKIAKEQGNEAVYNMLLKVDQPYAKTLHPNNLGRVIRALELFETEHITMSQQLLLSKATPSPFLDVRMGINYKDRAKLYERINLRVDKMLEMGLLEEAVDFLKINDPKTALQAIGIKELAPFINNQADFDICVEKLKQATRNYAKRQITWFKKDEKIKWFYADELGFDEILSQSAEYIKKGLSIC